MGRSTSTAPAPSLRSLYWVASPVGVVLHSESSSPRSCRPSGVHCPHNLSQTRRPTGGAMSSETTDPVQMLERELAVRAFQLTTPRQMECVFCYVDRMLDDFGCDNTLRWAVHWRELRAPRATSSRSDWPAAAATATARSFSTAGHLRPMPSCTTPRPRTGGGATRDRRVSAYAVDPPNHAACGCHCDAHAGRQVGAGVLLRGWGGSNLLQPLVSS